MCWWRMAVMVEIWFEVVELHIGFRLAGDDMMMIMMLQMESVINRNLLTTQVPSRLGAMNAASQCSKRLKMLTNNGDCAADHELLKLISKLDTEISER